MWRSGERDDARDCSVALVLNAYEATMGHSGQWRVMAATCVDESSFEQAERVAELPEESAVAGAGMHMEPRCIS
jgi:hypothetical protein